jgi:hypothetical protein
MQATHYPSLLLYTLPGSPVLPPVPEEYILRSHRELTDELQFATRHPSSDSGRKQIALQLSHVAAQLCQT